MHRIGTRPAHCARGGPCDGYGCGDGPRRVSRRIGRAALLLEAKRAGSTRPWRRGCRRRWTVFASIRSSRARQAAVVIPGRGVRTGTSGEADTRTHRPVTDRTLFAAGSVTKPFIAALMLTLAERDVLELDDHLSRWVPGFPDSRLITLRQLLGHRSGTANFTDRPRSQRPRSATRTQSGARDARCATRDTPTRPRRVLGLLEHELHPGRARDQASDALDGRARVAPPPAASHRVRPNSAARRRAPARTRRRRLPGPRRRLRPRADSEQRLRAQQAGSRPPRGLRAACWPAPRTSRAPATAYSVAL